MALHVRGTAAGKNSIPYPHILTLFLLLMPFFLGSVAKAYEKEYTVFDVRKSLPLHDDDPVYHDYYVNIGTDAGVNIDSILAVYRHVPVIDIYRNKAEGDLVVPIGHMKVIQAQKTMSVCRVLSVASEKQIPVVQYEKVMMGDSVELAQGSIADAMRADGERAPASSGAATTHHKAKKRHKRKPIRSAKAGVKSSAAAHQQAISLTVPAQALAPAAPVTAAPVAAAPVNNSPQAVRPL